MLYSTAGMKIMDHATPDGRRIGEMGQLSGMLLLVRDEAERILVFAESIEWKSPEDA